MEKCQSESIKRPSWLTNDDSWCANITTFIRLNPGCSEKDVVSVMSNFIPYHVAERRRRRRPTLVRERIKAMERNGLVQITDGGLNLVDTGRGRKTIEQSGKHRVYSLLNLLSTPVPTSVVAFVCNVNVVSVRRYVWELAKAGKVVRNKNGVMRCVERIGP